MYFTARLKSRSVAFVVAFDSVLALALGHKRASCLVLYISTWMLSRLRVYQRSLMASTHRVELMYGVPTSLLAMVLSITLSNTIPELLTSLDHLSLHDSMILSLALLLRAL